MSPINRPTSRNPSQRALDERNALDYSLSHAEDKEKEIEHDRVKEAYKNFSIEKEETSFATSLKNGFKNVADLIFLKPLGIETFKESSVRKNNEKYFYAGGPDYLNERDPKQQETQPQDNKSQKPKEGFFVAAFKKIFKVTSVPKQVREDIKIINTNPKNQFNFTKPEDGATIEDNPVSNVVISNQSKADSQEPNRFKEYRERSQIAGSEWRERVLATYPNEENSRDPNNSGVKASSNSSSGQGLKLVEPSSKTPQPPQSLNEIKPTKGSETASVTSKNKSKSAEEVLRENIAVERAKQEALLAEERSRHQKKFDNARQQAKIIAEEKSKTLQTPLNRSIKSLASKTEKLKGLVFGLQTSTTSLEPQKNNVKEPKVGLIGSEALIGVPLTTTTATSSSTRTSSTATSTVANNPEHSSPTTPPKVEKPQKEPLPRKERDPNSGAGLYAWRDEKTFPRPDPDRKVAFLRPPNPRSSSYLQSEVSHRDHTSGFTRNGTEMLGRMVDANKAEKALEELEASKAKARKAPSRQTQATTPQIRIPPCGHASEHTQGGKASFVARLATAQRETGGIGGGRELGG